MKSKPQPQLAFMGAFLVLLVLPLVVMFGLMALGVAASADMMAWMNGMMRGDVGGIVLSLAVIWIVLMVVAVLGLAALLIRRARS
jgi:hypothetical protein